jgi:cytochrome b6-f complex iron-sulfur subunit
MVPLIRTLVGLIVGWLGAHLVAMLGRFQHSPMARRTTRRMFTRNAALGAVGIVTAEITVGTGLLMWPNKTGAFGSELSVSAVDVPPVMGKPFQHMQGKFFLVHNQDGLLALYTKCPHLGCAVPWKGPPEADDAFKCPCHGSMYNYNGERTGGPAPRPMDLFQVTVGQDGSVRVQTSPDGIQRDKYEPDQAAPYPA